MEKNAEKLQKMKNSEEHQKMKKKCGTTFKDEKNAEENCNENVKDAEKLEKCKQNLQKLRKYKTMHGRTAKKQQKMRKIMEGIQKNYK